MIKGKEGIALILAIVFMLAITILLTGVLLLSTQEINATQLYLDGNKAFYYAEAGVEYAQARILKAIESGENLDEIKDKIKSSVSSLEIFRDSNIKYGPSLSIEEKFKGLFITTYSISCSIGYGKAYRKITKEIQLFDKRLDKAIASNGNIEFNVNSGQSGQISIIGDIYATQSLIFGGGKWEYGDFILEGNAYASNLSGNLPLEVKPISGANFNFPQDVDITSYRMKAKYYVGSNPPTGSTYLVKSYSTVNEFLKDLSSPNPPRGGIVYIDSNFHMNNLENINIEGLTFVVNGELSHANNINKLEAGSENSAVEFIARKVFFNKLSDIALKNSIIYATEELRFVNVTNINIDGGGLYLAPALSADKKIEVITLGLENIKSSLQIISLPNSQKQKGIGNYFFVSWSDASV